MILPRSVIGGFKTLAVVSCAFLAGCASTLPAYEAPAGRANVTFTGATDSGPFSYIRGQYLIYLPKDACTHSLAGTLPFSADGITTIISPGQTVYFRAEFTRSNLNSTTTLDSALYLRVRPGMSYDVRAAYRGASHSLSIREVPSGGDGPGREVGILHGELPGC